MQPAIVPTRFSRLLRPWRMINAGVYLLLCIRFLVAGFSEVAPASSPAATLVAGGFLAACFFPHPSLFAFLILTPWLTGLNGLGLLAPVLSSSLVFCAMSLGWLTRDLIGTWVCRTTIRPDGPGDGAAAVARLLADFLTSAILLSLALRIAQSPDLIRLWRVALSQAILGYGDPAYFLTTAFLWLQGLFCFCRLVRSASVLSPWIRPLMLSYAATFVLFCASQYFLRNPTPYQGYAYYLPLEDISSFGSLAVAVFVFLLAVWSKATWAGYMIQGTGLVCLATLVVASWSRGAWLAGILSVLLLIGLRLPRRLTMIALILFATLIALINVCATHPAWLRHPYLVRLSTLVRLENPMNKSSGRLELWHKAAGMIRERPITGHGIGSFYLNSPRYALPGDPDAQVPNFAHNTFLQFAAELGLPAALALTGLAGWILWRGLRHWLQRDRSAPALPALGVTLALGAYLMTQMTANSLNVYASNQFFFWFLMAALLTWSRSDKVSGPDSTGAAAR